jgi:hypothetical protein
MPQRARGPDLKKLRSVVVQVVALILAQYTRVELADLVILAGLTLVSVVTTPGHDVVPNLHRCLSRGGQESGCSGSRRCAGTVAVREIDGLPLSHGQLHSYGATIEDLPPYSRRRACCPQSCPESGTFIDYQPTVCREHERKNALSHEGTVDWDLVDVRTAQTVVLCVPVEECTPLEERVRRQLDAGNERPGRERSLLDVTVIILRVAVEHQLADGTHRELRAGPDLGHVEGVEVNSGSL